MPFTAVAANFACINLESRCFHAVYNVLDSKDTEDPESIRASVVFPELKVILTIGLLSCMVTGTMNSGSAALTPESIGLKLVLLEEDSADCTVVQMVALVPRTRCMTCLISS